MRFLVHWLVVGISLGVAAYLVPGVHVATPAALVVGALVLGLVNALVRPVLTLLTLPITIVTLGVFYLVVNGLAFGLAAWLVPGFSSAGLVPSMLGALVVSVCSWALGAALRDESKSERRRRRRDD